MRLRHPAIRAVGRPITIQFEGKGIAALEGESVAAALSAAGVLSLRRTQSGAPRGLHCGIGACFDCLVTIDGRVGQRACVALVADGMEVSGGVPRAFAPLGPVPTRLQPEERTPDVLVVGAGAAGLSAAIAAREAGASVVLLDEREKPGGQYLKPLAASQGYAGPNDAAPDGQFGEGDRLRAAAVATGLTIETGALAWGAFAPDEIAAVVRDREIVFRPRRLILAPGAHERPMPLPGWTLPGVMTTGGLQTLARAARVCPAEPVIIAGSGPLNFQLAAELVASGVRLGAVVEAAPRPGVAALAELPVLAWNAPDLLRLGVSYLLRLRRARVPIFWASAIAAIDGDDHPSAVRIATPAGERRIAAGLVALNAGFQPETGLARALGAAHHFVDVGLGHLATITDEEGRTSLPAVFAVGDGAEFGGARVAAARGRLAGLAAARDLGFRPAAEREVGAALARAKMFQRALWRIYSPSPFDAAALADGITVCRCEEVTAGRLRTEIAHGATSLAALKRATRAGMGPCQGRFCAAIVVRFCAGRTEPLAFAFPRPPIRPVPITPLMFPGPEFAAEHIPEPTLALLPSHLRAGLAPALPQTADVLVVGGGIVGLATAFYLAREGIDVLIAERQQDFAMAASTANAGSLHVQLLAYDFSETGPPDGGPAAATLPLGLQSIALWKEIAAEAGEPLGIVTDGGLMVAENEQAMRWLAAKVAMENRHGIPSRLIGKDELHAVAPALSPALVGADFCPGEGYGDPLRGSLALRRLAERSGARLLPGAEVTALARVGSAWHAETSSGPIRAGSVVNAAGPYARRVAAMAGLAVPVSGTVQQVVVTAPVPPLTRHLVLLAGRHLSLKQQANGSFLLGGGWFGEYDEATGVTKPIRCNIEANLWLAGRALPALAGLSAVRAWTGMAPEIDAAPLLGEAPGIPGFFSALAANAYTLGPVIGRLTAAAIHQRADPDPVYTLARFADRRPIVL
jgi:D-hydroxyproline dehydrogenase subunit alpha